jgi:hypothetical protein
MLRRERSTAKGTGEAMDEGAAGLRRAPGLEWVPIEPVDEDMDAVRAAAMADPREPDHGGGAA